MGSLDFKHVDERLKKISSSFCAAKWGQVLFNLQVGSRQSCCLGDAQSIDPELLKKDPNHLFNDSVLAKERQEMLDGKQIEGCRICWKTESHGHYSDRHHKSATEWAAPFFDPNNLTLDKVIPSYVEVSFGNKCQMMCTYCSPLNSSSLAKESRQFGSYQLSTNHNILETDTKLYLDDDEDHLHAATFWEWFLQSHQHFKVLRFTGGEPLLSKWLFKFLDWLEVNSMAQAELAFNSNLSVPAELMDKFIHRLKSIPRAHYKQIEFFTSLDGWGSGAELARYGISLKLFEQNIKKIQKNFPDSKIRITSTLNVFAFPDIKKLFEKVLELKKDQTFPYQLAIICYPIFYPSFLSLSWTKERFEKIYKETLEFIDQNMADENGTSGFYLFEKEFFLKAVFFDEKADKKKALIDIFLYLSQFKLRKKLEKLSIPDDIEKIFQDGLLLAESLELSELHTSLWVKVLPWVKSNQRRLEISHFLVKKIDDGELNPWEIVSISLDYLKHFNCPELIELWKKTKNHHYVGDELVRRLSESKT